uniref:Uncharacterized protein n=1 Tax=Rhizophora mucronata TaxID=61149 RepID=A0A2P2INP1_RHIMU
MSRKDSERDILFELLTRAAILDRQRYHVSVASINALQHGMQRTSEVDQWLAQVDSVLKEVNKLEAEYSEPKCYGSLVERIRRLNSSSDMARKLGETKDKIESLMEGRNSLYGSASLKSRLIPSGKAIVGLESAFSEVWSFIADAKVGIIGIRGAGGVGKTTLLKLVYDALIDNILVFNPLIWIHVPRHASLKTVQGTICEELGLSDCLGGSADDEENEIRRASAIFKALGSKRFVIMLDDLQKHVELEKIGVPWAADDQSNSKIIFTTRSSEVCCQMKADKTYLLKAMSVEDAQYLLEKEVGNEIFQQNASLFGFLPEIVQACGRLPYAIVTVGRALRGRRREYEWKGILNELQNASSHANLGQDDKRWFAPLKLTYDSLSSRTMKESFLYCSLLPKGHRIDKDQLVDYWIGEGFMEEIEGGLKDRRYKGYDIIEKLIDKCLFEEEGNFITMNQLVRQMALRVASEEGRSKYFVKAGVDLYEVPIDEIPKEAVKISLMQNRLRLPPSPPWPQVSTLLLSGNKFKDIPDDFFSDMPSLQVLDLSNCEIEELPEKIGLLVQLRYLNLSWNKLKSLCMGLQELEKLEMLYLSDMDGLHFIPVNLFKHLVSLQLLNMYHCGHRNWMRLDEKTKGADLLVGDKKFLEELESLSKLEHLEISLNGDPALEQFESSEKLRNCVRSVSIGGCQAQTVSAVQFMNLGILEVSSCPNLLNFRIDGPEMDATTSAGVSGQNYFNNLLHVKIESCWSLEELLWLRFAPNLQTLHVEECINLKRVIGSHGDKAAEAITVSFFSLKRLYLRKLPSLTSISDLPLLFRSLEEILVSYCPRLRKLPVDLNHDNRALKVIKGEEQWFHALHWDDDETKNFFRRYLIPV